MVSLSSEGTEQAFEDRACTYFTFKKKLQNSIRGEGGRIPEVAAKDLRVTYFFRDHNVNNTHCLHGSRGQQLYQESPDFPLPRYFSDVIPKHFKINQETVGVSKNHMLRPPKATFLFAKRHMEQDDP